MSARPDAPLSADPAPARVDTGPDGSAGRRGPLSPSPSSAALAVRLRIARERAYLAQTQVAADPLPELLRAALALSRADQATLLDHARRLAGEVG